MNRISVKYKYYVAIACFFFELIALGLVNGTSSLYIKSICADLGFSRGLYSFVFTISSIFGMIASLLFGLMVKKFGSVKKIFIIGSACLLTAITINMFATEIYHFFIGAVLTGFGFASIATVPISVVIAGWFPENRGAALGFVLSGSGIGGAILNPLVSHWIADLGWRVSYRNSLILIMIICLPALFVIKDNPADQVKMPEKHTEYKLRDATKYTSFWLIVFAVILIGMAVQPIYINSAAHLSDNGLSSAQIGMIISVLFLANTGGKLFLGVINDRFGIKCVYIINCIFFVLAVMALIFARTFLTGTAFAIAYGISYTILSITPPLIVIQIFGEKAYGAIIGIVMALQTAGYSIGAPLCANLYDRFQNYRISFVLAIVFFCIGSVLIFSALKMQNRMIRMKRMIFCRPSEDTL